MCEDNKCVSVLKQEFFLVFKVLYLHFKLNLFIYTLFEDLLENVQNIGNHRLFLKPDIRPFFSFIWQISNLAIIIFRSIL